MPGDQPPPHANLQSSSSSNSSQSDVSSSQRPSLPDSSSSSNNNSVNTESIFYTGELDDDDRYDSDSGNAFDDGLESEAEDEYAAEGGADSDSDGSDGFVGAKYIASNDPDAAKKVSTARNCLTPRSCFAAVVLRDFASHKCSVATCMY
jgi:hypothetical protein